MDEIERIAGRVMGGLENDKFHEYTSDKTVFTLFGCLSSVQSVELIKVYLYDSSVCSVSSATKAAAAEAAAEVKAAAAFAAAEGTAEAAAELAEYERNYEKDAIIAELAGDMNLS